jgi:hypothetical protein
MLLRPRAHVDAHVLDFRKQPFHL